MPAAVQLLAVELEFEMALREALVRIADRLPTAAIPDDHRAAAILALRDRAFEIAVFERVILDMHRQTLLAWHRLGPRVTAQLLSTPSISSRRS